MRTAYHRLALGLGLAIFANAAPAQVRELATEPLLTESDRDFQANPTAYRHTSAALGPEIQSARLAAYVERAERPAPPQRRVFWEVRRETAFGSAMVFQRCEQPTDFRLTRIAQTVPQRATPTASFSSDESPLDFKAVSFSATVYDGRFTRLSIVHDGAVYRFWSNVDFNLLRAIGSLETADVHYSIAMSVWNESLRAHVQQREAMLAAGFAQAETPRLAWVPEARFFRSAAPLYRQVDEDNRPATDAPPAVLAFLNALHAHYSANADQLREDYVRQEAVRQAVADFRAANPREPANAIVRFFPLR